MTSLLLLIGLAQCPGGTCSVSFSTPATVYQSAPVTYQSNTVYSAPGIYQTTGLYQSATVYQSNCKAKKPGLFKRLFRKS